MSNENRYDDIIDLPHHVSKKHPHMSMHDRAAQFSPFAALTGHGAAIEETARLTDEAAELDESRKEAINEKLMFISESAESSPEATIVFFVPDGRKFGGEYVSVTGKVKKIDAYKHDIVMTDGRIIPIENIYDIRFEHSFDE